MALHIFKAAGGVGPIADDAGQSGAAFFDDVTFNGTTGEVRNLDAPRKRPKKPLHWKKDGERLQLTKETV